jgi:hypothetical protein
VLGKAQKMPEMEGEGERKDLKQELLNRPNQGREDISWAHLNLTLYFTKLMIINKKGICQLRHNRSNVTMSNPTPPPDDLEAVRTISTALQGFPREDQERILRWVREKLGLSVRTDTGGGGGSESSSVEDKPVGDVSNIKSFVNQKKPKSDNEFAAVVAYFYRFKAPETERKEEITSEDLQDAARKADYTRLKRPIDTLHSAFKRGILDKGGGRGLFKINTVGENLVAMALPVSGIEGPKRKTQRARRQVVTKKPNRTASSKPKKTTKKR